MSSLPEKSEVSYGLKDQTAAEAQLLTSAVDHARARAQVLAQVSNASLSPIHRLSHSFPFGSSRSSDDCPYRENPGLASSGIPEFNPEKVTVSCDVRCSWELIAK